MCTQLSAHTEAWSEPTEAWETESLQLDLAEGAEARTESDEAWALGVCVYELLALR